MGIKDHGYYGFAFFGCRPIQFVSLITIIGMTGNFIAEIAHAKQRAPSELVGTIVMSCLAVLWTLLSITAYDETHLPYIMTASIDAFFLIPFIVIASVLGQPLSYTTCSDLPKAGGDSSSSNNNGTTTPSLNTLLAAPAGTDAGSQMPYQTFAQAEQGTCLQLNAVWGLSIALCVLYAISAVAAAFLFIGQRRANAAAAEASSARDMEMGGRSASIKEFSDAGSFYAGGGGAPGPLGIHTPPQRSMTPRTID